MRPLTRTNFVMSGRRELSKYVQNHGRKKRNLPELKKVSLSDLKGRVSRFILSQTRSEPKPFALPLLWNHPKNGISHLVGAFTIAQHEK